MASGPLLPDGDLTQLTLQELDYIIDAALDVVEVARHIKQERILSTARAFGLEHFLNEPTKHTT